MRVDGAHVRIRQQRQFLQPLDGPAALRQIHRRGRLVEVPLVHSDGKIQVPLDQEPHDLAILNGRAEPLQRGFRQKHGLRHVFAAARGLAQVVHQNRSEQQPAVLDLFKQPRETLPQRLLGAGEVLEKLHRHDGVLIHGVAVVEVPHHQALHSRPFRQDGRQHAGLMHGLERHGRVGQRKQLLEERPAVLSGVKPQGKTRQVVQDPPFRIRRQANSVPRDEQEHAFHKLRVLIEKLGGLEVDPFLRYRDLGVGEPRSPIAKLGEQRAAIGLAEFHPTGRGAMDATGVHEVSAHPTRGVRPAYERLLGDLLLRIERQQVAVAPGLVVQVAAQRGQEVPSGIQFGKLLRDGHLVRLRRPKLAEPSHQLEIPQTAGRLLDVRLQVIDRVRIARVPDPGQPCEMVDQLLAAAMEETRERGDQLPVEIRIAGQQALIEQADVQLDIAVVNLAALRRSPHGVAQPQALIPERPQKRRQRVASRLRPRFRLDQ